MSLTGLIINLLVLGCLILSFKKNSAKTKQALRIGRLVLTVVLVTLMGLVIERLMERGHKPDNSPI